MSINWNRATSKTVACAALLLVGSCTAEVAPNTAASTDATVESQAPGEAEPAVAAPSQASEMAAELESGEATLNNVLQAQDRSAAKADEESEREARTGSLAALAASGAEASNARLDELDMGFDMSELKIDLGGAGTPATGLPAAGPGLQKAVVASSTTRGGMRLARGETAEHGFGDVREGEAYTKDFRFVSDGVAPLVVKSIKPSCGCTRSEIELSQADGSSTPYVLGEEIAVGQKFVLLTEMSTDGKHGHTEITVNLTSNDPKGQTAVRLTADVEKVLELDPANAMVLIDEMTVLEQKIQKVKVKSTRGEMFKLAVGPEIQLPDSIKIEFSPIQPDAEGRASAWDVTMKLGPGLDEGRRNYPIYLASDIEIPRPKYPSADGSPKFFTAILSTQVNVIGLVSASPSFVGFGMVRPGQEVERWVEIKCADGAQLTENPEVKIMGLYDDDVKYADAYEVSFEPLEGENGMRMRLLLKGMAKDVSGSFGGRVEVKIGHAAKETLTIKFSGICRAVLPGQ